MCLLNDNDAGFEIQPGGSQYWEVRERTNISVYSASYSSDHTADRRVWPAEELITHHCFAKSSNTQGGIREANASPPLPG
jgi:hypothetical protein